MEEHGYPSLVGFNVGRVDFNPPAGCAGRPGGIHHLRGVTILTIGTIRRGFVRVEEG